MWLPGDSPLRPSADSAAPGSCAGAPFRENSPIVAPASPSSRRSPRTEGRVYTSLRDAPRRGCAPGPLRENSKSSGKQQDVAVYVVRMEGIGRSAGRSATAAAAYRSGEQVKDERTGKTHDYTGKTDIYDSEILKPAIAPERLGDRTTLWNEVEQGEKRKDAQLSREFLVALPVELNNHERQELTRDFVQDQFVDKGMIADVGYHDFNSHNPHAHIMLTMRSVDEEGFGKKKREWNKREKLQQQREAWARHANAHLEQAGYEVRIDHRSLKEQGSERQPQPKLGPAVMNMEAKGIRTDKGDEFRRVNKANRDLESQQARRSRVRADIQEEQSHQLAAQPTDPIIENQTPTSVREPTPLQTCVQKSELKSEKHLTRLPNQFKSRKRIKDRSKDQGIEY